MKKFKHQGQCLEVRLNFSLMQPLVLKNFTKFTGKHLSWSHFFTKFKAWNFIKKRLQHRYFPGNFVKCFKKPYLQNTSGWLLMLIPLCLPRFYPLITLCLFFFHFFWLLLIIAVMGVCSESIKIKILLFTRIYSKINMNVAKTILPQQ